MKLTTDMKLGRVLLVAGVVLLVPGSIGMGVYWDSPKTQTCHIRPGREVPCSPELIPWVIVFAFGIALSIAGALAFYTGRKARDKEAGAGRAPWGDSSPAK
ncbi:MAG: hypothetical protein Q6373_020245 [Candidatus Sigynarchaeota archaeon]